MKKNNLLFGLLVAVLAGSGLQAMRNVSSKAILDAVKKQDFQLASQGEIPIPVLEQLTFDDWNNLLKASPQLGFDYQGKWSRALGSWRLCEEQNISDRSWKRMTCENPTIKKIDAVQECFTIKTNRYHSGYRTQIEIDAAFAKQLEELEKLYAVKP